MKQIFLIATVLFSLIVFSQKSTIYIDEDFSGDVPPIGWTIDNLSSQWSQSTSTYAGGTAPEAQFMYSSGNHTSRLISPEIDLTGATTVVFTFNHMLNSYIGSGYSIGVSTRSGIGSWTPVWEVNPTGHIYAETKNLVISNVDVGSPDFQICFYVTGNMYNISYWWIDDVTLIQPDTNDASIQSINVTPITMQGEITIECNVKNLGVTEINSIDLNYQIDTGAIITENLTGLTVPTAESFDHIFTTPWTATPGNYLLKVWVSNMNGGGDDDDPSNDMQTQNMYIATQSTQNLPFFEEFTSSTCAPCKSFNSDVFTPFMDAHPDDIAVIKYQMNWPGSGDPYYTAEGGVRKVYYGVIGVPSLFAGGIKTGTNSASVNTAYTDESSKNAFFDISSNFDLTDNIIDVNVDIMPYITKDMTVHIVVIENETFQNTGSNGETSFRNVMMKMLPDAEGTLVNFITGVNSNLSASYDMSSTFVEELEDLSVVVFIQDEDTKEVMQSLNATKGGLALEDSLLQSVSIYPNPTNEVLNVKNAKDFNVVLYDLLGREIYSKNNISNEESIQTYQMAEGTYFLKLSDGIHMRTDKILIAR